MSSQVLFSVFANGPSVGTKQSHPINSNATCQVCSNDREGYHYEHCNHCTSGSEYSRCNLAVLKDVCFPHFDINFAVGMENTCGYFLGSMDISGNHTALSNEGALGLAPHLQHLSSLTISDALLPTPAIEELARYIAAYNYRDVGTWLLDTVSITSRTSIREIKSLHHSIQTVKGVDDYPKLLIGCKSDLEALREVSREEGLALARSIKCSVIEISSKSGTNVTEAFDSLARAGLQWRCQSTQTSHNSNKNKSTTSSDKASPKKEVEAPLTTLHLPYRHTTANFTNDLIGLSLHYSPAKRNLLPEIKIRNLRTGHLQRYTVPSKYSLLWVTTTAFIAMHI
ncbi:hypothetical protein Pelo_8488 [Pelomyxa schiedti]|nr:hypothetical protein Pelo_8488 [Pelomyxa schiedti]